MLGSQGTAGPVLGKGRRIQNMARSSHRAVTARSSPRVSDDDDTATAPGTRQPTCHSVLSLSALGTATLAHARAHALADRRRVTFAHDCPAHHLPPSSARHETRSLQCRSPPSPLSPLRPARPAPATLRVYRKRDNLLAGDDAAAEWARWRPAAGALAGSWFADPLDAGLG